MNKLVQIVLTNRLFYTTTEQKWFIGLIVYVFCKQSLVKFVCSAWVVEVLFLVCWWMIFWILLKLWWLVFNKTGILITCAEYECLKEGMQNAI